MHLDSRWHPPMSLPLTRVRRGSEPQCAIPASPKSTTDNAAVAVDASVRWVAGYADGCAARKS
jgi:hypothetical protein